MQLLTKSPGITAQERVVSFPSIEQERKRPSHRLIGDPEGYIPCRTLGHLFRCDICLLPEACSLTSTQRHRHAYTRFTYCYSGCPFIGWVTLSLPTWFLLLLGDALPCHLVLELYPGATTHICLSSSCESLQPWQWQPLWLADVCLFVQKLKVLSEHILLLPSSLHSTSHSAESRVIC